MIILFPSAHDGRGDNYELLLAVWCTKTLLFVFTPSVLAAFIAWRSTGEIDVATAKATSNERFTKVILGIIVLAVGVFLASAHLEWYRVTVVAMITLLLSLVAYPVSLMLRPLIIRVSRKAN